MTTEQYIQAPVGTTKQTDPFWFRKNSSATIGVTAQPSNVNPNLGIEDIIINSGSQAQLQHKILAWGTLKTIIGSISFQIKLSAAGAPFVQTVSTENGTDEKGNKTYWEHIQLRPAIKAQIMRLFEALQAGVPINSQPVAVSQPVNPMAQMMNQFQQFAGQFNPQFNNQFAGNMGANPYAQFQQPVSAPAPVQYPDYSQYANVGAVNNPGVMPANDVSNDDLPV